MLAMNNGVSLLLISRKARNESFTKSFVCGLDSSLFVCNDRMVGHQPDVPEFEKRGCVTCMR